MEKEKPEERKPSPPKPREQKKPPKVNKETREIKREEREVVPIRSHAPIKVKFTPRVFRTPAREDKDAEYMAKLEIWKNQNKSKELRENGKHSNL